MKYVAGKGANTYVDLYALWILLRGVRMNGCNKLQVLDDSKIIIDWENKNPTYELKKSSGNCDG